MAVNTNILITAIYAIFQATVALVVSVVGAVHVRRCIRKRDVVKQKSDDLDDEKAESEAKTQSTGSPSLLNDDDAPKDEPTDTTVSKPSTEVDIDPQQDKPKTETSEEEKHIANDKSKTETPKDEAEDGVTLTVGRSHPVKNTSNEELELEIHSEPDDKPTKRYTFCTLWLKTVWKMRNVYAGFAVHSFDVLTDILVIIQWMQEPNIPNDHINPQIMAYCGIFVLIFSKVISCFAIYLKEGNMFRCILQLFDLLIFVELYQSHKKVVSTLNKKGSEDKNEPIESTFSFKYIRNFEANFESIPQSVLQLVYVIRTGTVNMIFVVSITQSIISMTNSILNTDYTLMQDDKWKKYKRRLPPSKEFIKHALCRLSEVAYRIGLLSLFWSVCGGEAFAVMFGIEMFFIVIARSFQVKYGDDVEMNAELALQTLSWLITIPSEEVYWDDPMPWYHYYLPDCDCECDGEVIGWIIIFDIICCGMVGVSALLQSFIRMILDRDCEVEIAYKIPTVRIGLSLEEFGILMVYYTFWIDPDSGEDFLLSPNHGLSIFITTCILLVIYTQYNLLFPNFALPRNVGVKSKYGFAYSNELNELIRFNVPVKKFLDLGYGRGTSVAGDAILMRKILEIESVRKRLIVKPELRLKIEEHQNAGELLEFKSEWWTLLIEGQDFEDAVPVLPEGWEIIEAIYETFRHDREEFGRSYNITNAALWWDEPVGGVYPLTAAVFALAKENYEVVEWLEEQGATIHKEFQMTSEEAKDLLGA
eukprot:662416_1